MDELYDLDSPVSFCGSLGLEEAFGDNGRSIIYANYTGGTNASADHIGLAGDVANTAVGVGVGIATGSTGVGAAVGLGLSAIDRGYGIGSIPLGPGEANPGFNNYTYPGNAIGPGR